MRTSIIALLFQLLEVAESVYFAHKAPVVCLPSTAKVWDTIGQLYAYPNKDDHCVEASVHFDILDSNDTIGVNRTSGMLFLKKLPLQIKDGYVVTGQASCTTLTGSRVSTSTSVTMKSRAYLSPEEENSWKEDFCFAHLQDNMFNVEENSIDLNIGRLSPCLKMNGLTREYSLLSPRNRFTVDPASSELRLIKQLDREFFRQRITSKTPGNITGQQPLKIECQIKRDNITYEPISRTLKLLILDVNDCPPTFENDRQYEEADLDVKSGFVTAMGTIDKIIADEDINSVLRVVVLRDPLAVCQPELLVADTSKYGHTTCRLRVKLVNLTSVNQAEYQCLIGVVDDGFSPTQNSDSNNTAVLAINIHMTDEKIQTALSITSNKPIYFYRNATRYSRLMHMSENPSKNEKYGLDNTVFSITPKFGIIYLNNVGKLATCGNTITLSVVTSSGLVSITVNLLGEQRTETLCDDGCSFHKNAKECRSGCGVGLTYGQCEMRGDENFSSMSSKYATCTHNTATCPDMVCDELEKAVPELCPQDCTNEVIGQFVRFQKQPGISMAKGFCLCYWDSGETMCDCMPKHPVDIEVLEEANTSVFLPPSLASYLAVQSDISDISSDPGYSIQKTEADDVFNDSSVEKTEKVIAGNERTSCKKLCIVAIGVGVTVFLLISFSLFMLWFTKKLNDRRKSNIKHVGSVTSMSGVTSEYPDDREGRLSYTSEQWSPKRQIYSTQTTPMFPDDGKWEIDRESLSLEKTLGEGEFGLVLKGVLRWAAGQAVEEPGRNVAVKMLKHCASPMEEQDLWSEFTLLKDVSHPNVIKLIGACTVGGPFYLVVEYCEHGCLLQYLRRSRLEENGYINTNQRFKTTEHLDQTNKELTGDLLSIRDLLSFAWQIAKGMSYLSEIKLVHRDLAARNILVSNGKALKISDFGLTRDVYEADTYLKKSKGRIPVKWLAPESLYAQIYTTRSDIWSYGIVLWEIVTLGAPPYPGIPPERLYNLLIGGYRMDRPENCIDELYAVMQKCWKIDAADRPSFATLASIFDRILQEQTGYLDLSKATLLDQELFKKQCAHDKVEALITNSQMEHNSSDRSRNSRTVSNHNYCPDNYLVPMSSHFMGEGAPYFLKDNMSTDDIDDNKGHGEEDNDNGMKCNYMTPLLDMNINIKESILTKSYRPSITSELSEPMFRKPVDMNIAINNIKNSKNKSTIFPSEQKHLLSEADNLRLRAKSDAFVQIETTQC